MTTEQRLRERLHITQQRRAAERKALKLLLAGAILVTEIPDILKSPLTWESGLYRRGIRADA